MPGNTLFSTVFSGAYSLNVKKGSGVQTVPSPTFGLILTTPAATGTYTAAETLARNVAAAYLNCKSLKTPSVVVTEAQLQAMWTAALANAYRPTAGGAAWTTADVNKWLGQTFGA